jgi:hypothetical protein
VNRVNAVCPNLNATSRAVRVATKLGLLLLGLTAISLITMPITQHLWTWDRFLQGGQDFETGSLLILTALNLVLVLLECCKRNVGKLLNLWQRLSRLLVPPSSFATLAKAVKADGDHRVAIPASSLYQHPLLI